MTWYDAAWRRRAPITVDLHGGAGDVDVSATIPPDFPAFWDNVMANGNDVRVTDTKGVALDFKLTSWNATNKTGVIEIDDWASGNVTAAATVHLYWDNPNGPSSGQATFTIAGSGVKDGFIELGAPGSGSEYVIMAKPEAPGATNAEVVLSKTAAEVQHIWWNVLPALLKRRTSGNGSRLLEEIETATYSVKHSDGSDTTSAMAITADMRMLHPAWIRTPVQAGSSTANYVVTLTVTTTAPRTLNFHTTIKVRDISAPTP